MAEAGADIIVAHMGLTTGGAIGAETALSARRLRRRASTPSPTAARAVRDDVHRPLPRRADRRRPTTPRYVLAHCPDCHGFYGASSMERLPIETALTAQTRSFKAITRAAE